MDDEDAKGEIFSWDCAEYEIKTEQGNTLLLLVNHFKSKGYGKPEASTAKRLRQATRVRVRVKKRVVQISRRLLSNKKPPNTITSAVG